MLQDRPADQGVIAVASSLFIGACLAWLVACGSAAGYHDHEVPRPDFPFEVNLDGVDDNTVSVSVVGASYPDSIKATTNVDTGTSDTGSVQVDVDENSTYVDIWFVTIGGQHRKRHWRS